MAKGLRGLPGLNNVSEEERRAFMLANEDRLKRYRSAKDRDKAADILYNNQLFADKYGRDAFDNAVKRGLSYKQRNELLRADIVRSEGIRRFSPYHEDGQFDENKGMGSNWSKFLELPIDAQQKVLESDYKSKEELKAENKKFMDAWYGSNSNPITGALRGLGLMTYKPIRDRYRTLSNDKIFDNIYGEVAEEQSKKLEPYLNSNYFNEDITGHSDSDTIKKFIQAVKPGSYVDKEGNLNRGIPEYAAYYGEGEGDVQEEMQDFTIDDMRQVLAKKATYEQFMSPDLAAKALSNEAKRYITSKQSTWDRLGLFTNDMAISVASYAADKVNGLYNYSLMARDALGDYPVVKVDDRGNVIDPNTKIINKGGKAGYIGEDGKFHQVNLQRVSRSALHLLGKNFDGSNVSGIKGLLDPAYWSKAEQFGAWDAEEQEKYEKIGSSPHKPMYDPGDETDLIWETAKMASFGITDGMMMAIPFGVGLVGKGLKSISAFGKVGAGLGTILQAAGEGLSLSKAGATFQGFASASGIAYAYERNAFQESLMKNLTNADEVLRTKSIDLFSQKYNVDTKFRNEVNKKVQERANSYKLEYLKENAGNPEISNISEEDINKAALDKAKEEVRDEETRNIEEELKSNPEFKQLQEEAFKAAGRTAWSLFLPEAIKYGFVNTIGFRNFIFKMPNSLAKKAASNFKSIKEKNIGTPEVPKERLINESRFSTYKDKAKRLGRIGVSQAWGGAWTNGTDDMMVDAAQNLQDTIYNSYLDAYIKGESMADLGGYIEGLPAYWNGLIGSLGEASTWQAAFVGGAGSITSVTPHFSNIAHVLFTKSGREAFKRKFFEETKRNPDGTVALDSHDQPIRQKVSWKKNWGGIADYFVQNGLMNTYFSEKQSEIAHQEHADYVNRIMDKHQDFDVLRDLVTATKAHYAANTNGERETAKFVRALRTMQVLDRLGNDADDVATLSSVVMDSKAFIDRAAEMDKENQDNPFNEKELKGILDRYYSSNNIPRSPENDNTAIKNIAENARTLQEAFERFKEAEEEVNDIEKTSNERMLFAVKDMLIINKALRGFWKKRFDELQSKYPSSSDDNQLNGVSRISTIGGRKNADILVTVYDQQKKEFEEWLQEQEEEVSETEKEYTEALENLKGTEEGNNIYEAEKKVKDTLAKYQDAQLQKAHIEALIEQTEKKRRDILDAIQEYDAEAPEKDYVFTKDEIMLLDPVTRARMLDPGRLNLYSREQQSEIQDLKRSLLANDSKALDEIQELSVLTQKIAMAEQSYATILDNPAAAAVRMEAENEQAATAAHDLINRRIAIDTAEFIQLSDEHNSSWTKEAKDEYAFILLRGLNKHSLDIIDEEAMLPNYAKQIADAKDWIDTVESIVLTIRNLEVAENVKEAISKNIDSVIAKTHNKEEIISELQKAINEHGTDTFTMGFKEVIEKLGGIVEQKKATTVETDAEREAREKLEKEKEEKEKEEAKKAAEEAARKAAAKTTTPTINPPKIDTPKTPEFNEEALSTVTYDYLIKYFPEVEEDADIAEVYKNDQEKRSMFFRQYALETIQYLRGDLSAKDYLYSLYDLDDLSEEEIKAKAEATTKWFLPFINVDKLNSVETSETEETNEEAEEASEEESQESTVGPTVDIIQSPDHTDIVYKLVVDGEEQFKVTYNIKDTIVTDKSFSIAAIGSGDIISITKREVASKGFTADEINEIFAKGDIYDLKNVFYDSETGFSLSGTPGKDPGLRGAIVEKIISNFLPELKEQIELRKQQLIKKNPATDVKEEDSEPISYGEITINTPTGIHKTEVLGKKRKDEDNPESTILEIFAGDQLLTLPVPPDHWKISVKKGIGITKKEMEALGITKDTPFEWKYIEIKDGKLYLHGTFADKSGERIVEASKKFDLGEIIESKKEIEAIKLSEKGLPSENPNIVETDEGVTVVSDTPEQQVEELRQLGADYTIVPTEKVHDIEEENEDAETLIEENPVLLGGNALPLYDLEELKNRILRRRRPFNKYDSLHNFFRWLDATNTNLQNIIDDELYQYLYINNEEPLKVKFMVARTDRPVIPGTNKEPAISISSHLMLVIDYTDKVKKIHEKYNNGGVIESNGKKYLLIGVAGYGKKGKHPGKKEAFNRIIGNLRVISNSLFSKSAETFYVDDVYTTEIVPGSLIPGYIVHQLEGDTTAPWRTLTDLLSKDPKRNPHNIKLEDLSWGIETIKGMIVPSGMTYRRDPTNIVKNSGNTFVFFPSSDGKQLAFYIRPCMFNEIKDGRMKTTIEENLRIIADPRQDYNHRLRAIMALKEYLYFDANDNNIVITRDNNALALFKGGEKIRQFYFSNNSLTYDALLDGMQEMNPRVDIKVSNIIAPDSDFISIYEEAGALSLNTAKVGTAGSKYLIYPLNSAGKPAKPAISRNRGSGGIDASPINQIAYFGTFYQERNGKYFYDGVEVTDPKTIEGLAYNLAAMRIAPSYEQGNWSYYIFSEGENPDVARINQVTYDVKRLDRPDAEKFIQAIKERKEKMRRIAEAKKELQKLMNEKEEKEETQKQEDFSMDEYNFEDLFDFKESEAEGIQQADRDRMAEEEDAMNPKKEEKKEETKKETKTDKKEETPVRSSIPSPPKSSNTLPLNKLRRKNTAIASAIAELVPEGVKDYAAFMKFLKDKGVEIDSIDSSDTGVESWIQTLKCAVKPGDYSQK